MAGSGGVVVSGLEALFNALISSSVAPADRNWFSNSSNMRKLMPFSSTTRAISELGTLPFSNSMTSLTARGLPFSAAVGPAKPIAASTSNIQHQRSRLFARVILLLSVSEEWGMFSLRIRPLIKVDTVKLDAVSVTAGSNGSRRGIPFQLSWGKLNCFTPILS